SSGSRLSHPEVDEVAHMLFAPGMSRLFATHPPLLERLKAIDPQFDPAEIERVRTQRLERRERAAAPERPQSDARERLGAVLNVPLTGIAAWVGNPATAHLLLARDIRESLPEAVTLAARHPATARALLLALAL